MDRSEVIELLTPTWTTDSIGQRIQTETATAIYCERESITQSEFFNAGANGLKPEWRCTIYEFEYGNQEYCNLHLNPTFSVVAGQTGATGSVKLIYDGSAWNVGSTTVNLQAYGLTVSGNPTRESTIEYKRTESGVSIEIYNNSRYRVYRTYRAKRDYLELYLEKAI